MDYLYRLVKTRTSTRSFELTASNYLDIRIDMLISFESHLLFQSSDLALSPTFLFGFANSCSVSICSVVGQEYWSYRHDCRCRAWKGISVINDVEISKSELVTESKIFGIRHQSCRLRTKCSEILQ